MDVKQAFLRQKTQFSDKIKQNLNYGTNYSIVSIIFDIFLVYGFV